ncbi:MAG: type VI secretion system protein TssA [Kiloniellaceae bacterium]
MARIAEHIPELGLRPVSAEAPAGASARYEPEFERLEGEIAKLEAVNGQPVDWRVVVDQGVAILQGKSKDFLVASFLSRGLFELYGYEGLQAGLKIMRDMTGQYWDTLFPELKRPRARAAAATWMAEKLALAVPRSPATPADKEPIGASLGLLDELEKVLDERLADRSPSFADLRRALRGHNEALAQMAPAPGPDAAAPPSAAQPGPAAAPAPQAAAAEASAAAAPAPAAVAPGEIASDQDMRKAVRACKDLVRKVAHYRRGKDPADATAYRLLRQGVWMDIERAPPNRDGVTEIRAMAAERLNLFKDLEQAGQHVELIHEVETSFARAPFWLDAHRLSVSALEALGHAEARKAVIESLGGFLRRLPGLLDLRFADESPFADDVTGLWVQNEVLSGTGDEPAAAAAAPAAVDAAGAAPWLDAAKEARRVASKGKIEKALELFQDGRKRAESGRERFMWTFQQARFCQSVGRLDLAVPQLEYLDEEGERFRLEEWEPGLSLEIARSLLICYTNQSSRDKSAPERTARLQRLQARIIRLDILSAIDMTKK